MLQTFLVLLGLLLGPQQELRVAEDLRSHWKVLKDGKLDAYSNSNEKTVHLSVNLDKGAGHYLVVQSPNEFYLFVNAHLITKGNHMMLKGDSLRERLGEKASISIYLKEGTSQLTTKWMFYQELSQYDNPTRPNNSFENFILLAVTLLVIFFTALLRSNPQLTVDYLNFTKLFSFKRREDSQFVIRITSSVNLLFYFFCSLLTSLALIIAVHFSERMSLIFPTAYSNVINYFGLWLIISLIIDAVLMAKLLLASGISLLFAWRDTAGFQFFNFIRGLVVSLLLIGVVSILAFWLRINVDYYFLVKCFCVMLALNAILMFFKLLNRESTSAFHLFSYLCATEILPLVILTKVFLF